jgi:signal transduction histidine kinase/CheY-like chemotaxis protein
VRQRAEVGVRARVGSWFGAVPGRDPIEVRQAQLLQFALVALAAVFAFAGIQAVLRSLLNPAAPSPWANLIAAVVCLALIAGLRRGWFRGVTIVTVVTLALAFAVALAQTPEATGGPYLALLMVPIVLAGLLLTRWVVLVIAIGVVVAGVVAVRLQAPPPPGTELHLVDGMGNFLYAGVLVTAIVLAFGGSLRATLARVVAHQREVEIARAELEGALEDLKRETSERTRLQGEVAQQTRLESVGRLAGGVAHDFNNLLTAISGYAQLLKEDLGSDPDGARRDLHGIEQAAEQATSLTRQLLAFSRRQELRMDVVDVASILTGIEPLLRRLIGEQVTLVARPGPEPWPVLADRGQLESVIVNLAVNARDAMPTGGTLTIETANVVLDQTYAGHHAEVTPGPYVMIAVSDTGVGMDSETVLHIFEPFFTTKALGSGTGLGLATVYGTVRQSGGHIWVYSEPGQGTIFKLYLPRTNAPAAAAEESSPAPARPTRGEVVLLAEDEDLVRDFIVAALERDGHRVIAVPSGDSALEYLSDPSAEVGILVTDVVMPGIGGPELIRRATELRRGLPAILMSGYAAGALEGRPDSLDAVLLEKPFTAAELEATIAKVILESSPSSEPSSQTG